MIEFIQDPIYTKSVDELFPGRVRICGLGMTGAAACDQLMLRGSITRDLWVLDTDQQSVEGAIVSAKRLIGRDSNHGLGCGGDRDLAREIVAKEEMLLTEIVHGADYLILILGLGGATGVALAEQITFLAQKMETKVLIIGVKPMPFEGRQRQIKSIEAIASLRKDAHGVLVLSPDQLAKMPMAQKNIRYGFHYLHQLLATTAEAIAQIVCKRGLIQLSFADLCSLYGRYSGTEVLENFWISYAEDTSHDDLESLVEGLMQGPLFTDPKLWNTVDSAIAVVSGPRRISLSDVQDLIVDLQRSLPIRLPISTAACLEAADNQPIRLVLLLARTAQVTVPVVSPIKKNPLPGWAYAKTVPVERPAKTAGPNAVPHGQQPPAITPEPPVPASPELAPDLVEFEAEPDEPHHLPISSQIGSILSAEELDELAELSALAESDSFLSEDEEPEQPAEPPIQEIKPAESSEVAPAQSAAPVEEPSPTHLNAIVDESPKTATPDESAVQKESVEKPKSVAKAEAKSTRSKKSAEPVPQPLFTNRPSEIRRPNQTPYVSSGPPMIQNPPPEATVPFPAEEAGLTFSQAVKKITSDELARKSPVETSAQSSVSRPPKQEEIQFESVARGRFDKAAHTIYRGEDLDQPAFRRRRLTIRL